MCKILGSLVLYSFAVLGYTSRTLAFDFFDSATRLVTGAESDIERCDIRKLQYDPELQVQEIKDAYHNAISNSDYCTAAQNAFVLYDFRTVVEGRAVRQLLDASEHSSLPEENLKQFKIAIAPLMDTLRALREGRFYFEQYAVTMNLLKVLECGPGVNVEKCKVIPEYKEAHALLIGAYAKRLSEMRESICDHNPLGFGYFNVVEEQPKANGSLAISNSIYYPVEFDLPKQVSGLRVRHNRQMSLISEAYKEVLDFQDVFGDLAAGSADTNPDIKIIFEKKGESLSCNGLGSDQGKFPDFKDDWRRWWQSYQNARRALSFFAKRLPKSEAALTPWMKIYRACENLSRLSKSNRIEDMDVSSQDWTGIAARAKANIEAQYPSVDFGDE